MHDGKNSGANFQEKVQPCFRKISNNFKAWLDCFLINMDSVEQQLDLLKIFL